jgi:hypothetical protein
MSDGMHAAEKVVNAFVKQAIKDKEKEITIDYDWVESEVTNEAYGFDMEDEDDCKMVRRLFKEAARNHAKVSYVRKDKKRKEFIIGIDKNG